MTKDTKICALEELQQMLERIRHENDALQRLIKALKEQNKLADKEFQKNQTNKKSNL
jgi:hypothetical protein